MIKLRMKLNPRQIKEAISCLTPRERIKILRDFQDELFSSQLREIVTRIRSQGKTPSFKEITSVCEKVRREIYEEEAKGRR